MAFDEKYYISRKQKLQEREQRNIQKYLQAGFDFVEVQQEVKEQFAELLAQEAESKKAEKPKKQGKDK